MVIGVISILKLIELYEEYPCDNNEILNKREGEIQREIATINRNKAERTLKQYYMDNRNDYYKIKRILHK